MSFISVNWIALEKTFRSLCRRWVNPAVTDDAEVTLQGNVFAFLFVLPPLTLATALLAAFAGPQPSGAMIALAISLPVLASSLLSLSGSPIVRNMLIAAGGPMLVLSTSASALSMLTAASIACVAGFFRYWHGRSNWRVWQVSGLSAPVLAMVILGHEAAAIGPMSVLGSMPVLLMVALFIRQSRPVEQILPAANGLVDGRLQLVALAEHTGSLLVRLEKNGFVADVDGRSCDESLTPTMLKGRGMVDRLHVADRPAFLGWIGGLTSNSSASEFSARLSIPAEIGAGEWINGHFKRIHEGPASLLLSLVIDTGSSQTDAEIRAVDIGSLGHELRTPLNAIAGFSELLCDGFCGSLANQKQAEYLDLIHQSSRHLLRVTDKMLEWSRLESGTRHLDAENFIPAEAATLAIGIVAAEARAKGVGLDFNPACGFDEFRGDKGALTQILVNLLSNAIKFAPENGQVHVDIDFDKGSLIVTVRDDGPGMSAADQKRIGVPFLHSRSTSTLAKAGSGLGLSIVRQLTRLHGGSLQVESTIGAGTCVKVALSSMRPHRTNVSELRSAQSDESNRDIQIFGEFGHAKTSKTA